MVVNNFETEEFARAIFGLGMRLERVVALSHSKAIFAAKSPYEGLIALKVATGGNCAGLERIATEYWVGSELSDANLVHVNGCGLAAGFPFLMMDYMPSTLESLSAGGPVPKNHALQLILQIAWGVAVLHEVGLAHGDLKPSNILYDPVTGQVKVCDFGTVAATSTAIAACPHAPRRVTPSFAAPERLLRSGPPSTASDVFSLGLILLYLLCGRQPLMGLPVGEIMLTHTRGLKWDAAGLPAWAREILARCLERSPKKRYRSATEVALELENVVSRQVLRGSLPAEDHVNSPRDNLALDSRCHCARSGTGLSMAAHTLARFLRDTFKSSLSPGAGPHAVVLRTNGAPTGSVSPVLRDDAVTRVHRDRCRQSARRKMSGKHRSTWNARDLAQTAGLAPVTPCAARSHRQRG